MKNPIGNAIALVPVKKLVTCKRCGCERLAWVKLKSGKWALVGTSITRPFYHGENQAPEAPPGMVYAVKMAYHSCEKHEAKRTQDELLAIHPKAEKPGEILADAVSYLVMDRLWKNHAWDWSGLSTGDRKDLEDALRELADAAARR